MLAPGIFVLRRTGIKARLVLKLLDVLGAAKNATASKTAFTNFKTETYSEIGGELYVAGYSHLIGGHATFEEVG